MILHFGHFNVMQCELHPRRPVFWQRFKNVGPSCQVCIVLQSCFFFWIILIRRYLFLIQQPKCGKVCQKRCVHMHKWDSVEMEKWESCASFNYRHPPLEPIIGVSLVFPPPTFKLEHTRYFPLPYSAIDVAMETGSPSTLRCQCTEL